MTNIIEDYSPTYTHFECVCVVCSSYDIRDNHKYYLLYVVT